MTFEIESYFKKSAEAALGLEDCLDDLGQIASLCINRLKKGGTVYTVGNGGSAADAQHLAAELQGRFLFDRPGIRAVALTTDTSLITAIANDYSYEDIFSRQVEALASTEDVLIGFSTSGNSENVLRAIRAANDLGCATVGFTGEGGGKLAKEASLIFRAPTNFTPTIQQGHLFGLHVVCGVVEESLGRRPE